MEGTGPNLVVTAHPKITRNFILAEILSVHAHGFLVNVPFPFFYIKLFSTQMYSNLPTV